MSVQNNLLKNLFVACLFTVGICSHASAQTSNPMREFYEATRGVAVGITHSENEARLFSEGLFTEKERDAILRGVLGRDFDEIQRTQTLDDGQNKLPVGLQKKFNGGKQLPPGWERKFERGATVDEALWSKKQSLPRAVRQKMRNIEGTALVRMGSRVARVTSDTRLVIDVIDVLKTNG